MGQTRAEPARGGLRGSSIDASSRENIFRSFSIWRSALVVVAAVALLLSVVGAMKHQLGTTARSAGQALVRSTEVTSSPALNAAEEAYIRALWPVHGDVERSAVRISLGTIFYKTGDLERAALKDRLEAALVVYQRAEARISELKPPPSFAGAHEEYLAAIRLCRAGRGRGAEDVQRRG